MSIDELWSTILKQSSPSTAASSSKTVVFLGDSLCGKRTLLSKFCGQDGEIYRGHGLGFDYLPVKNKVRFLTPFLVLKQFRTTTIWANFRFTRSTRQLRCERRSKPRCRTKRLWKTRSS